MKENIYSLSSRFYRAFEDRFRGSRELISERLKVYLPYLRLISRQPNNNNALAIDLGCGRGEWLELLKEEGFSAHGVDLDDGMLEACKELGLTAEKKDALLALEAMPAESQSLVSGFHIAEHLPFHILLSLISESLRVLKPGGLLILETPNSENLSVGTNSFYLDPSHERPIPQGLLAFLAEFAGYHRVKVMRLSHELRVSDAPSLIEVIEGASPDYSIIAQKKADSQTLEPFDALFSAEIGISLRDLANKHDQETQQFKTKTIETLETHAGTLETHAGTLETHAGTLEQLKNLINHQKALLNASNVRAHELHKRINRLERKIAKGPMRLRQLIRHPKVFLREVFGIGRGHRQRTAPTLSKKNQQQQISLRWMFRQPSKAMRLIIRQPRKVILFIVRQPRKFLCSTAKKKKITLINTPSFDPIEVRQPELWIDVTMLSKTDGKTGVHRVVKNILTQLIVNPPDNISIRPIYMNEEGQMLYANAYLRSAYGNIFVPEKDETIEARKGDTYLGLDLTAHLFPQTNFVLQKWKSNGVKIAYVVYDLIAIRYPEFTYPAMAQAVGPWINGICQHAENLICISKAVADDLDEWIRENNPSRYGNVGISHFHLGANILPNHGIDEKLYNYGKSNLSTVFNAIEKRKTFLSVSTIEPRKGYSQLLASFEQLWSKGYDVNLVIVGKEGWNVSLFIEKIKNHPEINHRLFWLEGISDAVLDDLYYAATALVCASETEGFGLPLIEGAQHGIPIITRDLKVFREVAQEYAFYFKGTAPNELANAIIAWLDLYSKGSAPDSRGMPWLTWEQSTDELLKSLNIFRRRIIEKYEKNKQIINWSQRLRFKPQSTIIEGGLRMIGINKDNKTDIPLVSYITVVRNRQDCIERAIESVQSQTYSNIEHIVIDGSSTDQTLNIIRKYENEIDYYASEADEGIYDAINKAVSLAKGNVICILNSDDWLMPNAAQIAVEKLGDTSKPKILATAAKVMKSEGEFLWIPTPISLGSYFTCANICHNGVYATRLAYEHAGLYDDKYKIAADFKWLMACLDVDVEFIYSDKPTVFYSLGGASGDFKQHLKECMLCCSQRFPFLTHQDVIRLYACFFIWKNNLPEISFNKHQFLVDIYGKSIDEKDFETAMKVVTKNGAFV
jgi:glycosyltransferase involved in cell wall biosynthesis/SAM-dependent methyltransferase